jgi:ankyrin repeat protein
MDSVTSCLLENGTLVITGDKTRSSALQGACRYGHLDIARLLIKHGTNVNFIDVHGNGANALHDAAKIVRLLLENRADIQCQE